MADYKELIAELRKWQALGDAPVGNGFGVIVDKLTLKQAADAIEQLVKERDAAVDEMFDISILKNTIEGMASDADDNGEKDFAIRLTVEDAFALCRLEPVRHGHWIEANDGTHYCSNCGHDAPFTWDDIDRNFMHGADKVPDFTANYCYCCGAKMDEVSE